MNLCAFRLRRLAHACRDFLSNFHAIWHLWNVHVHKTSHLIQKFYQKKVCKEILPQHLLYTSCQQSSGQDFVQESCLETSYSYRVQRPEDSSNLVQAIFQREPEQNEPGPQRSFAEISYREILERSLKGFARRPLVEILYRDVARTPLLESCAETSVEIC